MNTTRLLITALAASGLFAAAHASVIVSEVATDPAAFSAPAIAKIVSPEAVPHQYRNETVRLSLTIDEHGRPSDIALARGRDAQLARRLFPAVAQWKFKPATRHGTPVATRVVLPVRLVDGPGL
jgi:TonB family protein